MTRVCGCFVVIDARRKYIPLLGVEAHTTIAADTSRTTLTQSFANPDKDKALDELQYVFPLYDGVSVVAFTCTVGTRVIRGVVKERAQARKDYDDAKSQGLNAGLLEQSMDASDVFTSRIGNVPPGETVKVDIDYLGELKHDAESNAIRFTIPTNIAPRYGSSETLVDLSESSSKVVPATKGFSVTVDAEMPKGSAIKSIQSPSHPISVQIGFSSKASSSDEPSLERASASLSLGSAELDKDFVLQVSASKLGEPSAMLEVHPSIPNQRALMATLVPRFNLPAEKPEIVFLCDRSGSMGDGVKIPNLMATLNIFLKSLPVGVKFNICSFGSRYEFLWERSQTYSQSTLDGAVRYVKTFDSGFGGTELYDPVAEAFKRRYKDMNLEVFVLTDGQIWNQGILFHLINEQVSESNGAIRLFTLGIGSSASHALIEGAARAGNGFCQSVGDSEQMTKKVVRMLKGALTPHVRDYKLEVKYGDADGRDEEEFELIDKVTDALDLGVREEDTEVSKKPISLFDPAAKDKGDDLNMPDAPGSKYDHLPQIDTPRYLQAPFQIPPLFPYNRTTVYLMLSDESPHRRPKSILLKGTSTHGPLELEIPITELADKGKTIHQLAARKAIGELEEGRGWIFHAKKRGSDKLLKEEFEGRFSDMVEREAVRIGVKYQVAGKWCSFVAVEVLEGREKEITTKPISHEMSIEEDLDDEEDMGYALFDGPSCDTRVSSPALTQGGVTNKYKARNMKLVGGGWGEPLNDASMQARSFRGSKKKKRLSGGISHLFGFASPSGGPSVNLARRGPPLFPPKPDETIDKGQQTESDDPLQRLASLQTFVGNWRWSAVLEKVLGLNQKTAEGAAKAAGLDQVKSDVVVTACVVAYLQKKLADDKDAWEMMADKAIDWARDQVGGQYDELTKAVWGLV